MMLGLGLYLIPLAMIANPDLIAFQTVPSDALLAALKIGAGLFMISFGAIAPWRFFLRFGLIVLGGLLLFA
jgi:hypothetical protein